MGSYDTQQVCLQGHQVTENYHRYPQHRRKHCPKCGAATLHKCPSCGTEIKGDYDVPGVMSFGGPSAAVPSHCEECGAPFPWTSKPGQPSLNSEDIWHLVHPTILAVARSRFEATQYADAAEAALKEVNARVKRLWTAAGNQEKDGKALMLSAFSATQPAIRLGDLSTESGRNVQEGYMHLFAGAMQGIRNPKTHDNLTIAPERALHFLFLASLLMSKLDEVGAA